MHSPLSDFVPAFDLSVLLGIVGRSSDVGYAVSTADGNTTSSGLPELNDTFGFGVVGIRARSIMTAKDAPGLPTRFRN